MKNLILLLKIFHTCKLTNYLLIFPQNHGNSLADQWLELCAFTAEDPGFIRGWDVLVKKIKKQNCPLVILPSVSFHFLPDLFVSMFLVC